MEVIILVLIIFIIFINFYKYKVKVNNKLLLREKDFEKLNIEYNKQKDNIRTISNLSITLENKNKRIEELTELIESKKEEKLIFENKIIYLEKKALDIGKELIKERNYNKEKQRLLNKSSKEKITKLKENNIAEIDNLKNIIEDKNKELNNLKSKLNTGIGKKSQTNNKSQKNIEVNENENKPENKHEIIERAKLLSRNSLWNDEAIKLNSEIIKFDNRNSDAYTRLAKCYLVKENYDVAEQLYKKVLLFDSENAIASNRVNDMESLREQSFKRKFNNVVEYLNKKFQKYDIRDENFETFSIFYNNIYNPYRNGNNPSFRPEEDGAILALKGNSEESIEKYTNLISSKLNNLRNIIDEKDIVIMSIPSSTVGNKNGINKITELMAKENGFLDKSAKLIRIKTIPKLATGGKRNKEVHLDSIRYKDKAFNLSNKIVILIDDVITTGNSLIATREILINYGAKYTIALGLTKTYTENYDRSDYREENLWIY